MSNGVVGSPWDILGRTLLAVSLCLDDRSCDDSLHITSRTGSRGCCWAESLETTVQEIFFLLVVYVFGKVEKERTTWFSVESIYYLSIHSIQSKCTCRTMCIQWICWSESSEMHMEFLLNSQMPITWEGNNISEYLRAGYGVEWSALLSTRAHDMGYMLFMYIIHRNGDK